MVLTKQNQFDFNIGTLKDYVNIFLDVAPDIATEEDLEGVVHILFCVVRQVRNTELTLAEFKGDEKGYARNQRELEGWKDSVRGYVWSFLLPRLKDLEHIIVEREKRGERFDYTGHPLAHFYDFSPLDLEYSLLIIISTYELEFADKNNYKGQFGKLKKGIILRLRKELPHLIDVLDAVE